MPRLETELTLPAAPDETAVAAFADDIETYEITARRTEAARQIAELNPVDGDNDQYTAWDQLVIYSRSDDPEVASVAQQKLFTAISPTIERAVRSTIKTRDHALKEDICQDTMRKILEKGIIAGQYKGGSFPAFAKTAATNTALSAARKSNTHQKHELNRFAEKNDEFGESALAQLPATDNIEAEVLQHTPDGMTQAIKDSGISDKWKAILYLHEVAGYQYQEIADQLGIPKGTVCSSLLRAKQQVRETIESQPDKYL